MTPSSRLAVLLAQITALSLAAAQVPPPPPPPPAVPSAPPPPPSTGNGSSCNPLKLSVCASLLSGLPGVVLPGQGGGNATNGSQCCPLLAGLVDLDAAVCLCTAIRTDVLGIINRNVPLSLRLLLNRCNKGVPDGFTCAPA